MNSSSSSSSSLSSEEKYHELLKQWKHEMAIRIAMNHRNGLTRMRAMLIAEEKIGRIAFTIPPVTWYERYKNLRRQYLAWRKYN